ncbi:VOC family protein [Roseovarius aestuarii]|nr:VOC family protein [Roseovarius aestuarii]
MLGISHLDHLVLTVADLDKTCEFYEKILGFEIISFGQGRRAMAFGKQKFNLHQAGQEFEPKALRPTPGSMDLCLITSLALYVVVERLKHAAVLIEAGPITRTGAQGPILSVYIRDPDHNLIEISTYDV